ncbi:MAG: MerR family transcriptional regulator [Phycisphaerales bacterium]|nr:MAG: MerR family transcriptional regulator [Phycisphaerales bacterium]
MSWEKSGQRLQVPAKRYRIGELVRYSPFSRQTIHNYTIMGLIREAEWTEGGHRLYDETVFDRLSRIMELKESMSLTEIRRVLNEEERAMNGQPYAPRTLSPLEQPTLPPRPRTPGSDGKDFMTPDTT